MMIKKTFFSLFMVGAIISLQNRWSAGYSGHEIKNHYLDQIEKLEAAVQQFKINVSQQQSLGTLKEQFKLCRIHYKKLAVLTDYFNPYETRFLNNPAISRIESEVADKIIPPGGFQAIEEILFHEPEPVEYGQLDKLLQGIIETLHKLKREPDLEFKFKEELVWDALRSAIVGITTSGITGLDSPAAKFSLKEAAAGMEGIMELLQYFKPAIDKKDPAAFRQLSLLFSTAKNELQQSNNFNTFNRLVFITDHINPIYTSLLATRLATGIGIPEGRSAINYNASSIFAADALNINFYSPPSEYWINPERIELGKKLFADPVLSGSHTRSCASCHQPALAFTDGLQKPYGLDKKTVLPRNTPTLYNSGYQTRQFFDSRADILENQLSEVVHNEEEMKGSMQQSVNDLKRSEMYITLFSKAYPAEKNPVNTFTIANAISSYVRSLQSLNSRFDQYMRGDPTKLNASEKKGFNLFTGKAKCATCHFIPLFNGVVPPQFSETESEVIGVPATRNKNPAVLDDDLGKYLFTRSPVHKYAFKTPTLRNIALTGPYMHNGVYTSLEEVMEFYNNGGGKGLHIAPENQTLPFDKLDLSKKEIRQIIAFMKALTDTSVQ